LKHFKQHRWLAFIDADEFFVFPQQNNSTSSNSHGASTSSSSSQDGAQPGLQDTALLPGAQQPEPQSQDRGHFGFVNELEHDITQDTVLELSDSASQQGSPASVIGSSSSSSSTYTHPHNLALFLSEFEGQGAVGINWVLFGSSGHLARPAEGPLGAYTACIPRTHWESTHVKVRYRRRACCPCIGARSVQSAVGSLSGQKVAVPAAVGFHPFDNEQQQRLPWVFLALLFQTHRATWRVAE
jgi:hypothetical protein